MMDTGKLAELLLSVGATFLALGLFQIASLFYPCYASPLRSLPGLRSRSLIFGNLKELHSADFLKAGIFEYVPKYGRSFRMQWMFSGPALITLDTKALHHIFSHSDTYGKTQEGRYQMQRFLGPGLLRVYGEQHRHQRKILNPAFGTAQIRALTNIFLSKSLELRDKWIGLIADSPNGAQRIDVTPWFNRMTLDIIGLAGFNYDFEAMEDKPNELADAFAAAFTTGVGGRSPLAILQAYIPWLRIFRPSGRKPLMIARNTMLRVGNELITQAKRSAEKSDTSKDLLSLLVRENLANTVGRMSDEEILAQVPTFLTAGHETTSSSLAWCLYALSNSPAIQDKLRSELLNITTDMPTMDELNSLQYLDKVVREVLRLHAPVPALRRTATKDDAVPTGNPYTDPKGVQRDTIMVRKGDTVIIPIIAIHRDKAIWGEDALEFKPDRWDKLPDAVHDIPSIWGNLLTFSTGIRGCIGYRFSVVETKAALFTLIKSFIFEPAVLPQEVTTKMGLTQRPMLRGSPDAGGQLPLIIKPLIPSA